MAIMQTGLFTVVFTLVRFKSQGVLRRLKATPVGASHFLAGQLTTRAIVVVLQTYILVTVGAIVLGVRIGAGRSLVWFDLTILALLGGALFIAIGLAISGWAKNEETAAPIANIISMPMMFLSGVFFPLSILPDWVTQWAQFLPLTYLADGMRAITVEGAALSTLGSELIGLGVWILISFAIATKAFRWE
jgi:ABC-2 type transport system permease protein